MRGGQFFCLFEFVACVGVFAACQNGASVSPDDAGTVDAGVADSGSAIMCPVPAVACAAPVDTSCQSHHCADGQCFSRCEDCAATWDEALAKTLICTEFESDKRYDCGEYHVWATGGADYGQLSYYAIDGGALIATLVGINACEECVSGPSCFTEPTCNRPFGCLPDGGVP